MEPRKIHNSHHSQGNNNMKNKVGIRGWPHPRLFLIHFLSHSPGSASFIKLVSSNEVIDLYSIIWSIIGDPTGDRWLRSELDTTGGIFRELSLLRFTTCHPQNLSTRRSCNLFCDRTVMGISSCPLSVGWPWTRIIPAFPFKRSHAQKR